MNKLVNQVHPPLPKKQRVDAQGNDKRRMYFKEGNSTMLFCRGVTVNAAKAIEQNIRSMLEKLGTSLEGHFIITR